MKCALCENFTLRPAKDDAEHREYAEMGLGRCKQDPGFGSGSATIYRAWNSEPECSKREPAKDMAAREVWLMKRSST
jgi:hypothetical protein